MGALMHVERVVLGGGLTGLSAGYHLQAAGAPDLVILERNGEVGGLARTETYEGFSFDHSIHILYTEDEYVASWIRDDLFAGELNRQARRSFCYSDGAYTEYPYQVNNYGLPQEVIVENIAGLIEAHDSDSEGAPPAHYEEWIYRTFGKGIAENFMIPYNRKLWAWDLQQMGYSWVEGRVPMPRLDDVIRGALRPPSKEFGANREFWYPARGGIQALSRALESRLAAGKVRCGCEAVAVDASSRTVECAEGSSFRYDRLISTLPLPALVGLIDDVPGEVREAAAGLNSNVVHTVNIGLRGSIGSEHPKMHWVYVPDRDAIFHRISFPHEFSGWMAPPGCASIQAEISESAYRPVDRSRLIAETLTGLARMGLLSESELRPSSEGGRVEVAEVITLDPAYVIYDVRRDANLALLTGWLREFDIETRGRFGEWEYFNMDHSLLSGRAAAQAGLLATR
jgi:UDP-galactopyranose mutase